MGLASESTITSILFSNLQIAVVYIECNRANIYAVLFLCETEIVFFFLYPKTVVPNLLTLGVPPSCHRDLFAADHLVRKTNKIDKYTRSGQEQSASGHIIHNVVCRKVRASGIRREDKVSHAAYAHRVFV